MVKPLEYYDLSIKEGKLLIKRENQFSFFLDLDEENLLYDLLYEIGKILEVNEVKISFFLTKKEALDEYINMDRKVKGRRNFTADPYGDILAGVDWGNPSTFNDAASSTFD